MTSLRVATMTNQSQVCGAIVYLSGQNELCVGFSF